GHDVSLYADVLGPANPDSTRKADYIRSFFVYLKKDGLLAANLAPHLRLRKGGAKTAGSSSHALASVELTGEGIEALKTELELLLAQRAGVREEIRKAMLDKDFRENAPLDAAKDKQGHLEARIREVETMLKRAVVVEQSEAGDRVQVGATVRVRNLASDKITRFVIVGPTEANAADGRISSVSPVGRSLIDRAVGDEVEVSAPAGTMRFRVEQIGD
ncbi:MAG TPA: transcription elongation factor GreA, partial [Dehalococcoidia bacterium]|nr:transcription elongation factor GreA [Dehalococcoidia bacterium]